MANLLPTTQTHQFTCGCLFVWDKKNGVTTFYETSVCGLYLYNRRHTWKGKTQKFLHAHDVALRRGKLVHWPQLLPGVSG